MKKQDSFKIPVSKSKPDLEKNAKELEEKKKKEFQVQNNTLNVVHFEDCDFENTTIILKFEAPD